MSRRNARSDTKSSDRKTTESGRENYDKKGKGVITPKVIITFAVALVIIAIVMAFNPNFLDWYNPLFNG